MKALNNIAPKSLISMNIFDSQRRYIEDKANELYNLIFYWRDDLDFIKKVNASISNLSCGIRVETVDYILEKACDFLSESSIDISDEKNCTFIRRILILHYAIISF